MTSVDNATAAGAAAPRPKMKFFSSADSPTLDETAIMVRREFDPAIGEALDLGAIAPGSKVKVLYGSGEGEQFSLIHAWLGEGYAIPRHSHSADCIYYILAGKLVIGLREFTAGMGLFVPANTPYSFQVAPGGVEYLEFRQANSFDLKVLDQDLGHWRTWVETAKANSEVWAMTKPTDW
jgi:mannose-6-phosphate isomerase-like protein (cupin superfamily)